MNQKSFSLVAFVFSFPFVCLAAACAVDTDPLDCATCTAGAGGGNAGTGGSAGSAGACTDGQRHDIACCNGGPGYQMCVDGTWSDCICSDAGAGGSAGDAGTECGQYDFNTHCTKTCPSGMEGTANCQNGYWSDCFNCHVIQTCQPGLIVDCSNMCSNGQTGTKKCNAQGTGYDACQCTGGQQHTHNHDADGDGYGDPGDAITDNSANPPSGYVNNDDDCDDTNASVGMTGSRSCTGAGNCAGTQTCSNGVWGACQCNSQYTHYRDADGDAHGTAGTGSNDKIVDGNPNAPAGYSNSHDDCNDNDASMYPGATELCDGKDNDCDGQTDEGCGTQDGGNPMSTVTIDYTAAGDSDISWAVPVIEGSWDGRDYAAFTGCTQSGLTAHCTFQMATGLVPSLKVQVALGNGKYWGDFSGAFPAECKTPSEAAALSGTSMTILGTLTIKVEGVPQTFHLCTNSTQKLPSCTGCCSASGAFPYYNAVLKPTC